MSVLDFQILSKIKVKTNGGGVTIIKPNEDKYSLAYPIILLLGNLYFKTNFMTKYWLYLLSYREIWARFLAFESNIGDLASILKVEKRRFTAFREEYEGKETALLVDRYKFMDLYPCSASELKALGYKVCT